MVCLQIASSFALRSRRHPRNRDQGSSLILLPPILTENSLFTRPLFSAILSDFVSDFKLELSEFLRSRMPALSLPNAKELSTLLVTEKGQRFDEVTAGNNPNFQIQSLWASLTTRIRKKVPEFRELSFNKLRKTADSLIRSKAGGEIASVFLCDGSPVGQRQSPVPRQASDASRVRRKIEPAYES
ncbi:hypothetical protein BH11PLA2_BH11PLA2_22190 [soil metagenome]